jgi:hypothetical protein
MNADASGDDDDGLLDGPPNEYRRRAGWRIRLNAADVAGDIETLTILIDDALPRHRLKCNFTTGYASPM